MSTLAVRRAGLAVFPTADDSGIEFIFWLERTDMRQFETRFACLKADAQQLCEERSRFQGMYEKARRSMSHRSGFLLPMSEQACRDECLKQLRQLTVLAS